MCEKHDDFYKAMFATLVYDDDEDEEAIGRLLQLMNGLRHVPKNIPCITSTNGLVCCDLEAARSHLESCFRQEVKLDVSNIVDNAALAVISRDPLSGGATWPFCFQGDQDNMCIVAEVCNNDLESLYSLSKINLLLLQQQVQAQAQAQAQAQVQAQVQAQAQAQVQAQVQVQVKVVCSSSSSQVKIKAKTRATTTRRASMKRKKRSSLSRHSKSCK